MDLKTFLRLYEKNKEQVEFIGQFAANQLGELLTQYNEEELEVAYRFYLEECMRSFRYQMATVYSKQRYREYR